ncbi:hypothetical protein I3760_12G028200 [Carya illinoinensis]|nr:hypothetical protein I3760_12G028200 [Carya illinoinensis]
MMSMAIGNGRGRRQGSWRRGLRRGGAASVALGCLTLVVVRSPVLHGAFRALWWSGQLSIGRPCVGRRIPREESGSCWEAHVQSGWAKGKWADSAKGECWRGSCFIIVMVKSHHD